jgi:hypothetical protein
MKAHPNNLDKKEIETNQVTISDATKQATSEQVNGVNLACAYPSAVGALESITIYSSGL